MESIDLRSSLFWNVAHHMLVVTYQSFGEAIGLIFKDQEVHEKFQAADGSITTQGVVWAVTNPTQDTDKWWAFVNAIMNHGFHKMQEMS